MRSARRLLWQSIAVRNWPLWSLRPRWLVAFVLAVIATDLIAIGVAASRSLAATRPFGLPCWAAPSSWQGRGAAGRHNQGRVRARGLQARACPFGVLIVPVIRIALLQWRIGRAPRLPGVFSAARHRLSSAASVTFHSLRPDARTPGARSRYGDPGDTGRVLVKETLNGPCNTAVKATDPGRRTGPRSSAGTVVYNDGAEICAVFW
jgi:hypothetical protein